MRLENWCLIMVDPFSPPELQIPRLRGFVYGHPNHEDGKDIQTTQIVGIKGDKIVTRSGSEYELGTIDPEYEKEFPNAKERLKESLRYRRIKE